MSVLIINQPVVENPIDLMNPKPDKLLYILESRVGYLNDVPEGAILKSRWRENETRSCFQNVKHKASHRFAT